MKNVIGKEGKSIRRVRSTRDGLGATTNARLESSARLRIKPLALNGDPNDKGKLRLIRAQFRGAFGNV